MDESSLSVTTTFDGSKVVDSADVEAWKQKMAKAGVKYVTVVGRRYDGASVFRLVSSSSSSSSDMLLLWFLVLVVLLGIAVMIYYL